MPVRAIILWAIGLLLGGVGLAPARAAGEPPERFLFLQRYALVAHFSLERGAVSVWGPKEGPGSNSSRGVLVEFKGVLDQESGDVLARLLERRSVAYLSLNSPGGLVEPTLRLGQVVRAKRATTIVEGGRQCYSACALLFLAGDVRMLGEYVPERPTLERKQAVVGFHAPYIPLPDGTARYLQDIKTSRVCAYLRTVVPPRSAAELCEYALATKGMATFSLALGRELGIFTAGEDEVLSDIASRALAALEVDDQRWVACQRSTAQLLRGNPAFALTPEYRRKAWPCSIATGFSRGPADSAQRVFLSRLALVLGPSELPAEVRLAALEEGAAKLEKLGPKASDEHAIACQRARLYLDETFPLSSQDPRSPEFHKTWGRYCFHRVYDTATRVRFGVGALMSEQIPDVLDYIAKQRGPAWFPPDFVPMPPSFPLPKEYE